MDDSRNEKIVFNEPLIRRIVYAVHCAVSEEAPKFRQEHHLETNNYAKCLNADLINENLRNHVVNDQICLCPFRRFVWEGRVLIDRENKVTYTVATFATLQAATKKHGKHPYYLQSLLFSENRECEGLPKQIAIADCCENAGGMPFTAEEYETDFDEIFRGTIHRADNYRHYVIAYSVEHFEITDIRLLLLDCDFAEVDSISLMDYVIPDFAMLTDVNYSSTSASEGPDSAESGNHQPYKLRPGLKPTPRKMEEEA